MLEQLGGMAPPGARKGQLQFHAVPDADITLLFAPRLITQRSVVQIHPPQPA
jgi:hypothetical protein